MDTVNVCYVTDNGYFEYTIVSMYSLLQTKNPTTCVNCYVICGNVRDDYKKFFLKLSTDSFHVNLIDINVQDIPFKKLDGEWSKYITNLTYARFMLPQLIKDVDRILYLDGDTIIRKDLSELFQFDMKFPIYGVPDYSMNFKCEHWDKVQYVIKEFTNKDYINAGVLLFNLKELTKLGFLTNAINCYKSRPDFIFADQDILNFKFKEHIGLLHTKYNMQLAIIEYHKQNWTKKNTYIEDISNTYHNEYDSTETAICDSAIVHLAGTKNFIYDIMTIYDMYETCYDGLHKFLLNQFITLHRDVS